MEGGDIWCGGKKRCNDNSCFDRAVLVCGGSSGFDGAAVVLMGLFWCVAAARISMRQQLFRWRCFGV